VLVGLAVPCCAAIWPAGGTPRESYNMGVQAGRRVSLKASYMSVMALTKVELANLTYEITWLIFITLNLNAAVNREPSVKRPINTHDACFP
jgi:hypothetical protein